MCVCVCVVSVLSHVVVRSDNYLNILAVSSSLPPSSARPVIRHCQSLTHYVLINFHFCLMTFALFGYLWESNILQKIFVVVALVSPLFLVVDVVVGNLSLIYKSNKYNGKTWLCLLCDL